MKRDYRSLTVWQKAMDMVTEVYRLTQRFPKEEVLNGLVNSLATDN